MSSTNVDTIRNLYAAFGRGDVPTVLAGMDADIQWDVPSSIFGDVAHARGPAAVGAFFQLLPSTFEEIHVEPKELLDAGDQVVAIGHHVGRGKRGSFDVDFVHVWTLRDGQATAFHEVADTAPIVAAL